MQKFITVYSNKIIVLLSIAGIILSVFLWNIQISHEVDLLIPCTPDGGCEEVLTSSWSKLFGLPIALYGIAYYFGLTILSLLREFKPKLIFTKLFDAALVTGVLFSLYLRYLEFFKIGNTCVWCWLSVLFIVIISFMRILQVKSNTHATA